MIRETNPGLKILWVWALGTAGILVTTVLRTRMKDMEKILNSNDHDHDQHNLKTTTSTESIISDTSFLDDSDQVFPEDKS